MKLNAILETWLRSSELARRWNRDEVIDYRSPTTAWTQEMLAVRNERGDPKNRQEEAEQLAEARRRRSRNIAKYKPGASLKESYEGYRVDVWEERGYLQITLYDSNDNEIRSWSDDGAREMFEDGFFNRKNLEKSVVEYAREVGLI